MRVTIITEDGFVSIDNEGYGELDLSFIPYAVHALQWYDTDGEIEYQDDRGRATENKVITSLTEFPYFDQCYQLWQQAKVEADAHAALEAIARAEAEAEAKVEPK
jgi:hypothetical protein